MTRVTRASRATLALALAVLPAFAGCAGDSAPASGAGTPGASGASGAAGYADVDGGPTDADAAADAAPLGACAKCFAARLDGPCQDDFAPCAGDAPCLALHQCAMSAGCFDGPASTFGTCVQQACEDWYGARFAWFPTLDCGFSGCKDECNTN